MHKDHDGVEPAGLWLRRRRESAGLTQEELAERSGLATRTLSNLESGRIGRPHAMSLRKLALALGLSARAGAELQARFRVDPRGGTGQPPPVASPTAVPRQLPATMPLLVGRSAEFAQLDRWLAEERRDPASVAIIGIAGMAGVGKTALALGWAHRVASEFPDGQLHVRFGRHGQAGQPGDAGEALGGILLALGISPERVPASAADRSELFCQLAAGRRLLIVIDDAQSAAQVEALAPGAASCLVVVTSRTQLTELTGAGGARLMSLDVLAEGEAAQLLSARVRAGQARDEPQAVREVAALCGRLPLALVIVAARAAATGWTLSLLAAQLADAKQRLDALDLGDPSTDIRSVFSTSCRELSPDATRLLRLLAALPGPEFAATGPAQPELAELARASLIAEHQPGRFRLHDLLRLYVAEQARAGDDPASLALT